MYKEDYPKLEGSRLGGLLLEHKGGPDLVVRLGLCNFPRFPPDKYIGKTEVLVALRLLNPTILSIDGWGGTESGRWRVESTEGITSIGFDSYSGGTRFTASAPAVIVDNITAA